jgi:hypothetical protein
VLAYDTVWLLAYGKVKFNPHLCLTGMNEVVIALSSSFPPQCPGHSVNKGRFAVAVIATDAGSMDAIKMEWWHIIPVAHKIAQC